MTVERRAFMHSWCGTIVVTEHMSNEQYERYLQWRDEHLLTRLRGASDGE